MALKCHVEHGPVETWVEALWNHSLLKVREGDRGWISEKMDRGKREREKMGGRESGGNLMEW